MAAPPPQTPKPGILVLTLHEGMGFSLPEEAERLFSASSTQSHGSAAPGRGNAPQNVAGSYANYNRQPRSHTNTAINAAPTVHGRYSSKHLPYALVDFDKQQVFVNAVSGTPEHPLWAGDNTAYKFDVSRATDLTLSFYIRNPNAPATAGRNHDIFIGTCRVNPRFDEVKPAVEDPKASRRDREKAAAAVAHQERSLGQSGAEWLNIQFGTGTVKVGVQFIENRARSLKIEDFELLKVVGKGSFGKVMQVKFVSPSQCHLLNPSLAYNAAGKRIHIESTL